MQTNVKAAQEFLETLYVGTDGVITIWNKQTKETHWFNSKDSDAAAKQACNMAQSGLDAYYGVGVQGKRSATGRGREEDITVLPGFFADIDIDGDGHKSGKKYPPDIETVYKILADYPLKPTIVVLSGCGVHAYWLFQEALVLKDADDRAAAKGQLQGVQAKLINEAKKFGYDMDNTADLSRLLRVPGTFNFKTGDPVQVRILEFNKEARYSPDEFLVAEISPSKAPKVLGMATPSNQHLKNKIEKCAYCSYCKARAKDLTEPEWHSMITNLAVVDGGDKLVHEISSPYPEYNQAETQDKIDRAAQEQKPQTCAYIQTTIGFKGCPPEGCGVEAPVGLVTSKTAIAYLDLMAIRHRLPSEPNLVLSDDVVKKLGLLKRFSLRHFGLVMMEYKGLIKNKIDLRDLGKVIDEEVKRASARTAEKKDFHGIFSDITYDACVPDGWDIGPEGIYCSTANGRSCACIVPVILSKRLESVGGGSQLVELIYLRDGRSHTIRADRATVFSKQKVMELANQGLPVSTETAAEFVRYLNALERSNRDTIPVVNFVDHLGWVGERDFLPGVSEIMLLPKEENSTFTAAFRPKGELEEWKEVVGAIRRYPIARMILAAGFAAPLIDKLDQRNIIVHIWGTSMGGKTAVQKAVASIWGHPENAMFSFNTTNVGLEYRATFLRHLPVVIDERQSAGTRQGFLDGLVYMFGEGSGRVRGNKNGGTREVGEWNTLAITSGEHPISMEQSAAGVKTRLLEVYAEAVIPDMELAARLHTALKKCFGKAGPLFIKDVITHDNLEGLYNIVLDKIKPLTQELVGSHVACLGVILVADILSSMSIFDEKEDEAIAGALGTLMEIIPLLDTKRHADEATRAMNFIRSWVDQNEINFAYPQDFPREHYGWQLPGSIYVFPNALRTCLEQGGFNIERVKKDFSIRGWIDTNGKNEYSLPQRRPWDAKPARVYVFHFPE